MTSGERFDLLLADLVLIVHFAFVAFVLVGLLAIWTGYFCNWKFVRNFWFRLAHVAAIGVVAAESVFGFVCPLTTWENELRFAGGETMYEESFVQHWLHRAMFFDLGPRFFTISYVIFFLIVLLSLWLVPWSNARRHAQSAPPPR
jgi:hypothetical protein